MTRRQQRYNCFSHSLWMILQCNHSEAGCAVVWQQLCKAALCSFPDPCCCALPKQMRTTRLGRTEDDAVTSLPFWDTGSSDEYVGETSPVHLSPCLRPAVVSFPRVAPLTFSRGHLQVSFHQLRAERHLAAVWRLHSRNFLKVRAPMSCFLSALARQMSNFTMVVTAAVGYVTAMATRLVDDVSGRHDCPQAEGWWSSCECSAATRGGTCVHLLNYKVTSEPQGRNSQLPAPYKSSSPLCSLTTRCTVWHIVKKTHSEIFGYLCWLTWKSCIESIQFNVTH